MKKGLLLVFVSVFGLVLLTGCGGSGNKVTCSADLKEGDEKYGTAEITAEFDDSDKVKSVSMVMNLKDEDTAQQVYAMFTLANSFTEDESQKIDAKLDGKKITISNYEAMSSDDEEKIVGMSKDDFIKKMEADEEMNAKCK